MSVLRRGIRALLRNPMRSGLLTALLTVSVALTLVMITVDSAFAKRMTEVQNQVGSNVTVSTGGGFGRGFGGGNGSSSSSDDSASTTTTTLTNDDASKLSGLDHVTALIGTLTAFNIDTTLTAPAITRPDGSNATFPTPADGSTSIASGSRISTEGTSDPASITGSGQNSTVTLSSGRLFTSDESAADVAVISDALASANNLSVGSNITIGGTSLQVIGIVSTGSFGGATSIYLPLQTAQTVLDEANTLTSITLEVDSLDNVDSVASAVTSTLGTDFNVTTSEDQYNQIAGTLKDAQNSSRVALVVSALSAALVILFGVVLAARQRIKEIGVMKAVGAANRQVVAQFGVETLIIGLIAGILGSLITFPIAQKVANGLVSSGSGSGGQGFTPGARGGGGNASAFFGSGAAVGRGFRQAGGVLGSVNVAVSPNVFLYALIFAFVLAIVASVGPAWQVSRVRPAEVLRYE